ncbi:MAG: hypothetical protein COA42_06255 [Alteromonadaceae bacterium]|nr:MAG: hypothetical protein COA42_06255 [Alteromonadaceae bacterium]
MANHNKPLRIPAIWNPKIAASSKIPESIGLRGRQGCDILMCIAPNRAVRSQIARKLGSLGLILSLILLNLNISIVKATTKDIHPNHRFQAVPNAQLDTIGEIISSVQDQDGFIWFGGDSGLARFDGYNIKLYRHVPDNSNSLSSLRIRKLLLDSQQRMWVATDAGLNLYRPQSDDFKRYQHDGQNPSSLSHNKISALYEDNHGQLWLGTIGGGLNQFQPETDTFVHYKHDSLNPHGIRSNIIWAIHGDLNGNLWIGVQGHGLDRITVKTGFVEHYQYSPDDPQSLSSNDVTSLYIDSQNQLWVGTFGGGLNRFNREQQTFTRFHLTSNNSTTNNSRSNNSTKNNSQDIKGSTVSDILEDSTGNLWVVTDDGGLSLRVKNKNIFEQVSLSQHFTQAERQGKKIRSIYQDRDNNLWLGHSPSGASLSDHYAATFQHFQHHSSNKSSLSDNHINALTEDRTGNIWFSTKAGIHHLDTETSEITRLNTLGASPSGASCLELQPVRSLLVSSIGELWIGSERNGACRFNPKTGESSHYRAENNIYSSSVRQLNGNSSPHLTDSTVNILYEDSLKNIWLGTNYGGLNKFNRQHNHFTHYPSKDKTGKGISSSTITAIFESRSGDFWVGTNSGLNRLNRETGHITYYKHNPEDLNTLGSDHITAISDDNKGNLWIGTRNQGVNKFDIKNHVFSQYTTKDGLASNKINALAEDPNGQIWINTHKGISSFSPGTKKILNYDRRHGFLVTNNSANINANTFRLTQKNDIFIGGSNGLSRFNPNNMPNNHNPAPVVLTELLIFNRPVAINQAGSPLQHALNKTQNITLSAQQSVFSIEYAGLNYRLPELNRYAYRLLGRSDEWLHTGATRSATFANLPSGQYTLEIKAANNEGLWSKEPTATLTITVLPHWWRTWWAYSGLTLIVIGALALLWFSITNRREARHQSALNIRLLMADQTKDIFLINTSQELHAPINGIVGIAESLLDGSGGQLSPVLQQNLHIITDSGRRLSSLVNDILDFSKLRDHTLELKRQPTDLYQIVEEVITLSLPLVATKPIQIKNSVSHQLPAVMADKQRLQQILLNLVNNAIRFTDEGSVVISAVPLQQHLWIQVVDTGIGISESKLSSIFSPFEQLDNATGQQYSGSGLGLSVSKELVELHGGVIQVDSVLGSGSTFRFSLETSDQ